MNIAYLCSGLLAALLIALSIGVSLTRLKQQRGYGIDTSSQWLTKVVRAQGNAAEYVPILVILILFHETEGASYWMDWVYIGAAVSRYSHAAGMLLSSDLNQPHPLRFVGSLGTYVTGAILSAMLILLAL